MERKVQIRIANSSYEVLDALEYITLADSFVKNKIGTGHGEAKLYVGNESTQLTDFFHDLTGNNCFFCKKDFAAFLADAESEFCTPQQDYVKKAQMPRIFKALNERLDKFSSEILRFGLYRVNVNPPRVYMNSNSDYYDFMRSVGLPNISYLSVLKILDSAQQKYYYFKIFIDYKSEVITYHAPDEIRQEQEIHEKAISARAKQSLIQARIGQGEYRAKLLEECPYCPFTMVNDERLLVASHIKPWAKADDKEKVDPKNGFMLTPTYDRLFDRGFITFDSDKTLVVSPWISPMNQKRLGIYTGKKIDRLPLDARREKYLQYHREYIFKK